MTASRGARRSLAPEIRAVLAEAVGDEMAGRIMVGSCAILDIDEDELFGESFDRFVGRMETVIPAIIGRPGEAVVERLWGLKDETAA